MSNSFLYFKEIDSNLSTRDKTDITLPSYISYILISIFTFGIYTFVIFFKRISRIEKFVNRKKEYYKKIIDFVEAYLMEKNIYQEFYFDIKKLKEIYENQFLYKIKPQSPILHIVMFLVTSCFSIFFSFYYINKIYNDIQIFEKNFDDKLNDFFIKTRISNNNQIINFNIDESTNINFLNYFVLSLLTFFAWFIVWDYKIHTNPENIYRNIHSAENDLLSLLKLKLLSNSEKNIQNSFLDNNYSQRQTISLKKEFENSDIKTSNQYENINNSIQEEFQNNNNNTELNTNTNTNNSRNITSKNNKVVIGLVVFLGLLIWTSVIASIFSKSSDNLNQSQNVNSNNQNQTNAQVISNNQQVTEKSENQDDKYNSIYSSVNTDKLQISITDVNFTKIVGNEFMKSTPAEGAIYLAVRWKYKNISQKPLSSFWSKPIIKLLDPNNSEYEPDLDASSNYAVQVGDTSKLLSEINPGITISEAKVFEVSEEFIKNNPKWIIKIKADKDVFFRLWEDSKNVNNTSNTDNQTLSQNNNKVSNDTPKENNTPVQNTNINANLELDKKYNDFKQLDKDLNVSWKKFMKIIDMQGGSKDFFIDKQLQWISKKDRTCNIRSNEKYPPRNLKKLECLTKFTQERLALIDYYIDNPNEHVFPEDW